MKSRAKKYHRSAGWRAYLNFLILLNLMLYTILYEMNGKSIYSRLGHANLADANEVVRAPNLYYLLQAEKYFKDLTQGRCDNFVGSDR